MHSVVVLSLSQHQLALAWLYTESGRLDSQVRHRQRSGRGQDCPHSRDRAGLVRGGVKGQSCITNSLVLRPHPLMRERSGLVNKAGFLGFSTYDSYLNVPIKL